jgi:hypothetical protein
VALELLSRLFVVGLGVPWVLGVNGIFGFRAFRPGGDQGFVESGYVVLERFGYPELASRERVGGRGNSGFSMMFILDWDRLEEVPAVGGHEGSGFFSQCFKTGAWLRLGDGGSSIGGKGNEDGSDRGRKRVFIDDGGKGVG